jgi:hypothetical protein
MFPSVQSSAVEVNDLVEVAIAAANAIEQIYNEYSEVFC